MSTIEVNPFHSPEAERSNWALFILSPRIELPSSISGFVDDNQVPHQVVRTDEENCLRMMTNTGMYDGERLILSILDHEFSSPAAEA